MFDWHVHFARPLLFAYSRLRLNPDDELSHELALAILAWVQRHPRLVEYLSRMYEAGNNPHPVTVAGIRFPNRFGLAAGLDKNGLLPLIWQAFGFGFIEIGTVLPRPQKGNDRPREFRVERLQGIVNRLGFNSEGVLAVLYNLNAASTLGEITIPIGVNVSKMRGTPDDAGAIAEDCIQAADPLSRFAWYKTYNPSSPNTPGLRSAQEKRTLRRTTEILVAHERSVSGPGMAHPWFVKIDPDGSREQTLDRLDAVREGGAAGLIVGNTTVERLKLESGPYHERANYAERGGLSGTALNFRKAIERLQWVREEDPDFPIIFVGGIQCDADYDCARDEGADLVQSLTGLVYRGPQLISIARQTEEIRVRAASERIPAWLR